MTRTRIKICGITRPEDALAAVRAGADAIGLVLHRLAGRYVPPDRARAILDVLPAFVTPVGLFVDAPADEILAMARELGLRHVQLHGAEGPDVVRALLGLAIVKAVHVDASFSGTLARWRDACARRRSPMLRGLVLETANAGATGGTGVSNDWAAAARHLAAGDFAGLPPVIVAGGLTPESVREVVRSIRPYAVDVSSGVEGSVRGQKSVERIEAFVRAVRDADAE